jgi:molybdopterin-guanine dinucleotide biosynthesis protein A
MGQDKAAVLLGGRSLLQRAVDAVSQVAGRVVLVGAPGRPLPPVTSAKALVSVQDATEGEGPLAGIIAGLEAAEAPVALLVGCDQPFMQPALLALLAEEARTYSAVLPLLDGQSQPLCSAVRLEALPRVRAIFEAGERAARILAALPGVRLLPEAEWRDADPEGWSFFGVNTPDELVSAEALLRQHSL